MLNSLYLEVYTYNTSISSTKLLYACIFNLRNIQKIEQLVNFIKYIWFNYENTIYTKTMWQK